MSRRTSAMKVAEFHSSGPAMLRIHIRFESSHVSVKGFGIPGREDIDALGWRFSLSAKEHGRVHGFLVEDTFYVRWLDPDHDLCPG